MTKLLYLAAMALLGLGLTVAQNTSPQSDTSNSSKTAQTQNSTTPNRAKPTPGHTDPGTTNQSRPSENATPNTTVQDQQNSTGNVYSPVRTGQNDHISLQPRPWGRPAARRSQRAMSRPTKARPVRRTELHAGPAAELVHQSDNPTPHLVMKSQNLNSTPACPRDRDPHPGSRHLHESGGARWPSRQHGRSSGLRLTCCSRALSYYPTSAPL